ncbi:MerR family DNA-binding transcriptional regulator [Paenibacillus sp. MBLB4367]|uniref:MerR family DNA-binding transcriptional regulator n=1 Tax=Paenibacillus sp. MBLB4367 TaxID=3384767 RepID=UPI0039081C29
MHYTVREVSSISNVTVKTLHHYHKIGLLLPCEISEAGYRLYLESEEDWKEAMKEQNEHLKETYDFDLLDSVQMDIRNMNDMAAEAAAFMAGMAGALTGGVKHDDEKIFHLLASHLAFLNKQGLAITAADFALQTRFFLGDDFHLRMLEAQQTGLAYYLSAAADSYAAKAQ